MDNLIVKLCLSILLCTIAAASSSQSSPSESVSAGMRVLLNSYSACEHDEEMINCLKYKFLRLADRMLNTSRISMYDGVSLVSKPSGSRAFSFQRDEAPIFDSRLSEDARESRIDSLIWQRVASLVNTKSVQFDVPKLLQKSAQWIGLGEEEEDEVVDGGRGKKEKKKKSLLLLAAMMVKGTMVALMFKKLALLAGSALVVSKIALTLAGLIALKKLFSQPAPEKTTYEIVKTPVVTHAHEYSHHGYSGGDEHSNSYGRSLEKEEFERRRIQAKRSSPVVKYEKYEPTPSHETPSKLPFYYINEADIVSDDQENGNTVEQEFTNNQGYDANHIAEIEEPVYENDRSGQRWSPKLSETVEPIRNTAQRYNQYGYRSARVVSLENVKDGDTSGMLSGAVEPSATEINAIYRSMRGSKAMRTENPSGESTKAMRTDNPSGESTSKVEASDNSSTKVDKDTSTAKVEKDSSAAKIEPSSTSDVQSPSSKFESRRRSRVTKEVTIPTNEKKSER